MLEGVLAGIDNGWFQQLIAEAAFEEQRRLESGDLVKVGVNAFVDPGAATVETLVIGPEAEAVQRESLARTRSQRDRAAADGALAALRDAAATDDAELIGPLIDCARARCTEGEIVTTLAEVFGRLSGDAALLSEAGGRGRSCATLVDATYLSCEHVARSR